MNDFRKLTVNEKSIIYSLQVGEAFQCECKNWHNKKADFAKLIFRVQSIKNGEIFTETDDGKWKLRFNNGNLMSWNEVKNIK